MQESIKLIANNKKAYHDYFIEEKYECGIELYGTEIKSIRQGKCSVKEAYVSIDHGEAFVEGMNISPYEKGNIFNKDPLRRRKLLLHTSRCPKRAIQSYRCPFTGRAGAARWRLGLHGASIPMTSARTSRERMQEERPSGTSKMYIRGRTLGNG